MCVSVYVCLKYLCRSGSDWPEVFNMAASWFEGVRRICLNYNDTVNKFHQCFKNSASVVNHSHMRTRANHCTPLQSWPPRHPLRNKRIYTCSGASWTRILPVVRSRSVHLNWLLWINETKRVWTKSVPVWGDLDTRGQQSGICGCSWVASC